MRDYLGKLIPSVVCVLLAKSVTPGIVRPFNCEHFTEKISKQMGEVILKEYIGSALSIMRCVHFGNHLTKIYIADPAT